MGKRIYFHAFWPFIYTKTEVLSRKTIISKNSGQSGDFWKLRFCVCVWTRSNGVLGSQTSQYATKNASHHVSVLCLQLVCLLIMDAVKVVLIYTLMQTPVCIYKHNCFSMEEQRRRTARRSAVFLLLSLPRRRLHCLPTSPPTVLDPTRANCCLVGKLRERSRPPGRMAWELPNVALITTVSFGVTASLHRRAYLCGLM